MLIKIEFFRRLHVTDWVDWGNRPFDIAQSPNPESNNLKLSEGCKGDELSKLLKWRVCGVKIVRRMLGVPPAHPAMQ